MKKKFLSFIIAGLAFGTIEFSFASIKAFASDIKEINTITEQQPDKIRELSEIANEQDSITRIYIHPWKESTAATLYFRNLPVLTFVNSPIISQERKSLDISGSENDPRSRAKAVATLLEQLDKDKIDARRITVSWDAKTKSYRIQANGKKLVTIDETTILPDTTDNLAQDALQATNRLRRLMGNAPPMKEIIGMPKPQAKPNVAQQIATRTVNIISRINGQASWYGPGFHGRLTANGETYNQNALTAAHRSLPFGTQVRVTNMNNGQSVIVRINDRGPFVGQRIIDLSAAAASSIGMIGSGVAPVQVEILGR